MNVRDQLLEAAARVYADAGYRGATTRRIAEEAGVNEITLFRQFGSKDSLMRAAIARCREGVTISTLPDEPGDPVADLLTFARTHLGHMRERRALIRVSMGEFEEHPDIVAPEQSPLALAAAALAAYLGRLRRQGRATAPFDERVAATMLMGVVFADAMGREIMREMFPLDTEETLEQYVRLFLRGLGVRA